MSADRLFVILNFGHWDLFEPALVRLGQCTPSSVFGMVVEALNKSGVISVWARARPGATWSVYTIISFWHGGGGIK